MAAGIYKITSPSGAIYIGQSWDIEKRLVAYKRTNRLNQPKIKNSILKYGYENHSIEIVHELPKDCDQNTMDLYEIMYWEKYKDCGFSMLNVKDPGRGGKHTAQSKMKMSLHNGSRKEEVRNKIRLSILGSKHSLDTINKMRSPRKKVTCDKCGLVGAGANMTRYHFENCGKPKQIINYRKVKCPHCGIEGKGSNMTRYHFNKCKNMNN
jgi:group I intron endonuclease